MRVVQVGVYSVIALMVSCSDSSRPSTFTLDREQAHGLEVVTLSVEADSPSTSQVSYEVLIGDHVANSVVTGEHELMFVVPDLPPTAAEVQLRGGTASGTRPLVILAPDPIEDPAGQIAAVLDNATIRVNEARAYLASLPPEADITGFGKDLDGVDAAIVDVRAQLATASPKVLEGIARFISVNALDLTPDILSAQSALRIAASPPMCAPTCEERHRDDPDDIPRCLGVGLSEHVSLIIGNIIKGALLGAVIGAIGGPAGAGVGAQIGGTIGAGYGIAVLQEWAWCEFAVPPRRLGEHFRSSFAGPNVRVGQTTSFELAGDYRVLNETDLSGGFSVMATIGSALAKLRDAIASTGKTNSTRFSLSAIGPGRTAVATTRYLRVEPPTQSAGGIMATASVTGNTVTVSASGQGGTSQQFSFELVYDNPDVAMDRTPFTITVLGSCGDGVAQQGEECDGNDLNGHACPAGGYMYCSPDCTLVDKCQAGTCTNGMAGYFPGPYQFNYCPNDPGYVAAGVYNSCCDQGCPLCQRS